MNFTNFSLAISAVLFASGCNGSKENSKQVEKHAAAIEVKTEEQLFEENIKREQELAIKAFGADGRPIESIASEAQIAIDNFESYERTIFTVDVQRYFRHPRKVCIRARLRDVVENDTGFSVRFGAVLVDAAQLHFDFELKASEAQVAELLKDRPGMGDEYVVVLESSKVLRREIEISTHITPAVDDTAASAEVMVVDIPVDKILKGSLIYFKLVRY
ncbi:MAG: hypothetical protein K8U03_05925 [Planctomycetia bacterium]|nr:hypothetical protein [Planctomycetia bacterium]